MSTSDKLVICHFIGESADPNRKNYRTDLAKSGPKSSSDQGNGGYSSNETLLRGNWNNERLIRLTEVPNNLPTCDGKKVHISSVRRWTKYGVRGRKLESLEVGGIIYTSVEAIDRFLGRKFKKKITTLEQKSIDDHLKDLGL